MNSIHKRTHYRHHPSSLSAIPAFTEMTAIMFSHPGRIIYFPLNTSIISDNIFNASGFGRWKKLRPMIDPKPPPC